MHAMIFNRVGGPEVFEYARVPTPRPGPGEVLLQVAYAGVNPADWKNREGMLAQFRPYVFPCIIGFDAAGVVAALGDNVVDLELGDRVFTPTDHGQGGPGSYAEYTIASRDRVARIPEGMGFREAAAIPVAALTAWQGLFDRGGLAAGDKALVHGGSGGVGSFAVQFARWAGAAVAATCSTDNVAYLQSLGVDRVVDYRSEDIVAAVRDWAPDGLDYLMDAVGASTLPDALDLVRPGGSLVSIPTLVDDGDIAGALAAAERRGIRHAFSIMDDQDCAATLERIAGLLVAGEIQLPPITESPLHDVARVHEFLKTGHNRGKRVLKVADL